MLQERPSRPRRPAPGDGPTDRYRGARIECGPSGHVCGLFLEGRPLTGQTFGVVGTITPLVDRWLDEGRLPDYMRAVEKG